MIGVPSAGRVRGCLRAGISSPNMGQGAGAIPPDQAGVGGSGGTDYQGYWAASSYFRLIIELCETTSSM